MIMIQFLILFNALIFVASDNSYNVQECSKSIRTINIDENVYTILQTPKFPQTFFNGTCNVQLSTSNANMYIWVAMLNGATDEIQFQDAHAVGNSLIKTVYSSNFDIVSFSSKSNSLTMNVNGSQYKSSWTAFHAAVVAYPKSVQTSSCPLSSQTWDFKSLPNVVIPISPTFGTNETIFQQKTCTWKFTIDSSQQLKIVPLKINMVLGVTVILNDDKSMIKNFSIQDNKKPFYFSGSTFILTYNNKFANTSDPSFFFVISAVTPILVNSTVGCQSPEAITGQRTVYTNRALDVGYPPYQYCSSSIRVPIFQEGTLSFTSADYEIFSDKLFLTQGKSSFPIRPLSRYGTTYKLTADVTNGQLIFTSDGNTQGAGYTVELNTYDCICSDANVTISCDETLEVSPMSTTDYSYCSNMRCNYTILPNPNCTDTYFHIEITNVLRNFIDFVTFRRNGIVDLNVTSNQVLKLHRYYSPSSKITIQFYSGPSLSIVSSDPPFWYYKISAIVKPNFMQISLDKNKLKHVQWLADMEENDALTVCASTETLEMFVASNGNNDLTEFLLYDGKDLDNFVGSLSSNALSHSTDPWLPSSIRSTSSCFTLYLPIKNVAKTYTVLFRIADDSDVNCRDASSVFQVPYMYSSPTEFDVSVKSTKIGSCEMIILSTAGYSSDLPHIWITNITANSDAKYSFKSAINDKSLLDLDGSEAAKWKYFGIYTSALSIIVPKSAGIIVHLSYFYQLFQKITILGNATQKGLMVSPSYTGFMKSFNIDSNLYSSDISASDFSLNLNVKEIYGTSSPKLLYDGKELLITKSTNVTTSGFDFYYNENGKPEENGFLIEYTIEPIPDTTVYPTKQTNSATVIQTKGFIVFIATVILLILF